MTKVFFYREKLQIKIKLQSQSSTASYIRSNDFFSVQLPSPPFFCIPSIQYTYINQREGLGRGGYRWSPRYRRGPLGPPRRSPVKKGPPVTFDQLEPTRAGTK